MARNSTLWAIGEFGKCYRGLRRIRRVSFVALAEHDQRDAGQTQPRSIASNSSSLITGTPSDSALASLLPASAPATT